MKVTCLYYDGCNNFTHASVAQISAWAKNPVKLYKELSEDALEALRLTNQETGEMTYSELTESLDANDETRLGWQHSVAAVWVNETLWWSDPVNFKLYQSQLATV